jgi:hypothetical protein
VKDDNVAPGGQPKARALNTTRATATPREAKNASSAQPTGCDFSEGGAMAQTNKQRLFLVLIVLAVVLLALGGWAVQALRIAR